MKIINKLKEKIYGNERVPHSLFKYFYKKKKETLSYCDITR